MTNNGRLIAQNGTYIVNDTNEYVANAEAYYMAEDTVISRIEVNGVTGTDAKGDYISTAATAVKGGVLLTPIGDDYFSAITLTSGSVTVILK